MKVTKLDYQEFKIEKQNILSELYAWKNTYKTFFTENYLKIINCDLRYHWTASVNDIITFLETHSEKDDSKFAKSNFAFFIAKDDNQEIQGIAYGAGPYHFRKSSYNFFGAKEGAFFQILDMVIDVQSMISRCLFKENKIQKTIGKELLKAIIQHVNSLDKKYSLSVCPHPDNQTACAFFKKHLFTQSCGSMGHTYTMETNHFAYIDDLYTAKIANKDIIVVSNYKSIEQHTYTTVKKKDTKVIDNYKHPAMTNF